MSIRYAGHAQQVLSSLESTVARLLAGQPPQQTRRLTKGGVRVHDAQAALSQDGAFRVVTRDDPDALDPYRLVVRAELRDPCADARGALRAAETELRAAKHDAVAGHALDALEAAVGRLGREADFPLGVLLITAEAC